MDMFIFSQMTQNAVSACRAAEPGDGVASLCEGHMADGKAGQSFGRM